MIARRVVAAAAVVLLAAGCGVPPEQLPRPLPTGTTAPTVSATETTRPTPSEQEVTLWFVREGFLVPAARSTTGPTSSQGLIDLLAEGPTAQEEEQGIRSAVVSVVTGEPLVVTADAANVQAPDTPDDEVVVVLQPAFKDLLSQEQVLVLGEVVTTLAVGSVRQVLFVDKDGQTLGVPTADGRLANRAVTPTDYAALVG